MKKLVLVLCVVTLLAGVASAALASDSQWCIYIRTGNLDGTNIGNGGDLILGASGGTGIGADSPFISFVATGANIASMDGAWQKNDFSRQDTTPPISYTFNVTIGVGGDYAYNRVFINLWSGTKNGLSTGWDMPDNYVVTIAKGTNVHSWTRAQMWVSGTTPSSGKAAIVDGNAVGFWYTYDSKQSFDNSTDDFIVTIGPPVPEPGSILALGSGLAGLAGFAIRRRRK